MPPPNHLSGYSATLQTPRLFHCASCRIFIRMDLPNFLIFCPQCRVLMALIAYEEHDYQPINGAFNAVLMMREADTGAPTSPQALWIPNVNITEEDVASILECAVCLEKFQFGETVSQLQCQHKFHKACIFPWLKLKPTCPLCRCVVYETIDDSLAEEAGL